MLRDNILDCNITLCCHGSAHKCSRLNLIRDNRILCAMQLMHAADTDNIRTCALNIGAHAVKEVCHVNNMRLFRRIFKNCIALSQSCRHHHVDCRTNCHNIKINMRAAELLRLCDNHTIFNTDLCAKHLETFKMLVDWAAADITSARKGYFRTFVLSETGSQKIIGCSDFSYKAVIHAQSVECTRVNFYCIFIKALNPRPYRLYCLQ